MGSFTLLAALSGKHIKCSFFKTKTLLKGKSHFFASHKSSKFSTFEIKLKKS